MRQNAVRISVLATALAWAFTVAAQEKSAKPPKPRPAATDQMIAELENAAARSLSAQAGRDKYEAFLASHSVSAKQREIIEGRMKKWTQRIDEGLVRVGVDWITPEAAKAIGKKADDLILDAFKQIDEHDFKSAKELLEKAGKADPSGVRADYLLGILNTPVFWNYAPAAQTYFERAYRRDPENAALLNNLALSHVKMGRFNDAIDRWSEALKATGGIAEVVNNLGRFSQEANEKRLVVPSGVVDRATKMYERAIADGKGRRRDSHVGWLYSQIVLPIDERRRTELSNDDRKEATRSDDDGAGAIYVRLGNGTGFVVHPHYLLTNRHVVENGTSIRLVDPTKRNRELEATVVAYAKGGLDLALVHCESLDAPPLPFSRAIPRRGTDVMALGFPLASRIGETLKSTRGQIAGLPNEMLDYLLIDAIINPGNSGGPILDRMGNVVAVCTIKTGLVGRNDDSYGGGLPIERALPLLRSRIDGFDPPQLEQPLEWPDVDEKSSRSTVLVYSYGITVPVTARRSARKETRVFNPFEDRTCTACKGRRQVPCPVKGCHRGSVTDFETSWHVQPTGYTSQIIKWEVPRSKSCPGCRGAGVVDCRHCTTGLDPRL